MSKCHNVGNHMSRLNYVYSKTCLKRPLKRRQKKGFQDQLSLHAGQKNCRMLQGEHSAILSTFIKLPSVIKIFVLSIFKWPLKTVFTILLEIPCHGSITVLPAKIDSDFMICLQSYRDLYSIDHLCINPILRIGLIHK